MPLRNCDEYLENPPPNVPLLEYKSPYDGTVEDCYRMLDITQQQLKQFYDMGIIHSRFRLEPELLDYCLQLCFCADHKHWAIKIKNAKGEEKMSLLLDYIAFADNEKQPKDDYTSGSEDNYDSDDSDVSYDSCHSDLFGYRLLFRDQKKKEEIKKEKKEEIKKEKKEEIKKKTIENRSLHYHIIFVFLLYFSYLCFPNRSWYYHIIFVFLLCFCYLSFPKVQLK